MTLVEGTYYRHCSEVDLKSDSGEIIEAGETYFWNPKAKSILTLNEGEVELLGLKDYSTDERKKLAKSGAAMRDGSYPIKDCGDVKDALHRIGTGKASKSAIVAHIRKRAKELGCSIPGSEVLNKK